MRRKLVIRSVRGEAAGEAFANLRAYEPTNPERVLANVYFSVAPASPASAAASWFGFRVATPLGLSDLEPEDRILSSGPLVVMDRFEPDALWRWMETAVDACAAATWRDSVELLCRRFHHGD
ncbi:MAG: Imm8 family immunity protein [Polyangiaceae bacterium]